MEAKARDSRSRGKLEKMLRKFEDVKLDQRDLTKELALSTRNILRFARRSGIVRREANIVINWPFETVTLDVDVEGRGSFYLIRSTAPKLVGKTNRERERAQQGLVQLYKTRRWKRSEIEKTTISIDGLLWKVTKSRKKSEKKAALRRLQEAIELGYVNGAAVTEQIRIPTSKKKGKKKARK